MHPFAWLGFGLPGLWLVLTVGFGTAVFAVHLLLVAAGVFLILGVPLRAWRRPKT